jgi:hypothetical protein
MNNKIIIIKKKKRPPRNMSQKELAKEILVKAEPFTKC